MRRACISPGTASPALKARDLDLISLDEWQKYNGETIEIRKMIFGYRNKVRATDEEGVSRL